jgi:transposase
MVFVDESGTHVALTPLYAWAPKGQRAEGQVPRNRGRTTTLLAALSLEGMQAPWTIEGGTEALAFETSVREVLAPTLKPGQIVILDNLAAHQGETVRQLVEARGCTLRFLPSYSPDLTPIEEAFSKIKTGLRRAAARGHEALLDAIGQAVASVTKDDALGWFQHAGYRPLAQSP